MPKDPILKKAIAKPDETIREVQQNEELSGENIEGSRRVQKLRLSSDRPTPNKAAGRAHYRRGGAPLPEQLDLYEEPSSIADGRPRQVRPSRRKSTVGIRCPLCGSEIRVAAIALTMECPGCHAIVDALEVARVVAPPPGRSLSPVPAQTEPQSQGAEPIFPEALPSFFVRPVLTTGETSTAQTPTSRRHMAPMVWIALGVTVLLGAVAGAGYWRINPNQGEVAPEVAPSLKTPPTIASTVPATVPPLPPRLVVGLPQLGEQRPPDEPTTMPVAEPPVAAPVAEAPASVPAAPVRQALATAKTVTTPRDDVFVVRFDSKLPGLTPSGLRALNAALRAAEKGRKVRIQIDSCEDHDSVPTGIDCAALTRGLKSILADRGVDHPADLIASPHPPFIFPW
jgi:hypothetical protein